MDIVPEEEIFRHSGWKDARFRIWMALAATGTAEVPLERFQNCGSDAWIAQNTHTQDVKVICNCCGHRLCLPCMRVRSNRMAGAIRERMEDTGAKYLHLTLTLASRPGSPLREEKKRLHRYFNELKRRPFWKDHCAGGVAAFETTWSPIFGWHPHLHILCESRWIPVDELRLHWWDVSYEPGVLPDQSDRVESWHLSIRKVTNVAKAAAEICKYVTKPADTKEWTNAALEEFILAMKGARVLATFGSWYRYPLEPEPEHEAMGVWEVVCRLSVMMKRAAAGEPIPSKIIELLQADRSRAARPPPIGGNSPVPPSVN